MTKVTIYSDGGSDPNPGYGGWAALLLYGNNEKELTGNAPDTTNNRMELTAAVKALEALKRPCEIDFYTDSEYLRRGITEWVEKWKANGWKRSKGQPVPNVDLWQALLPLTKTHTIEWHWVRGHSGNAHNERVDKLARAARLEITPGLEIADDVPKLFIKSSCNAKKQHGGWGVVLEFEDTTQQNSGNATETTANRMELLAALEALDMLPPGTPLQLFTANDYVFQGATKWIHGWRKRNWQKKGGQTVANADLWQKLDDKMRDHPIRWINAKGQEHESLTVASRLAATAVQDLSN